MTLLENIETLPDEIVILIKSFIPINVLFDLNNTYFNRFFPTILNKQRFPYLAYYNYIGNSAEKYVKNVIRSDNDYIFKYILKKFGASWKLRINHRYKNKVFKRYLDYLSFLCVEKYKSTRCRNCIYEINRNEFKNKNIKTINNTWNN